MSRDNGLTDGQARARRTSGRRVWLQLIASFGIAAAAIVPIATANASTRTTDEIHTGSSLVGGQQLVSSNGVYHLYMQRDGNFVLYANGKATWWTNTGHHPGAVIDFQRDGNLVIYFDHRALWASGTWRDGGAGNYLVVQDDGNVVIYNGANKVLWFTKHPPTLQLGDKGAAVLGLQRRLIQLHYWVGSPPGGYFGDATQQAVWALQKAAGLPRDGVVGPATWNALNKGVEPKIRPASGNLIEVNLGDDLLMIIRQGKLWATLNTSTGGGYTYTDKGVTSVAITPQGVFNTFAAIDGIDVDSLGTLWRPRFFTGGYDIHGDSYVPPYPVSHGCVRVSNEAINWIWADNIDPIGTEVWVY
ncbi:MAG: peptidoglycan-binding protein [Acidimicrobiales bacterium]